ncbi:MAG: DNA replication and repair protein RecF [Owenweeksia sp.]
MYLKSLRIINFKNWPQMELSFHDKLNCLVGPNGSGKTNVLDAIHYLSVCKSYFNPADIQNIKDEEGFFVVEGDFIKEEEHNYHIYCGVKRGQKKIFRKNKKDYKKLAEHIGQFPSVIISPYDRDLITEGSDVRRKFMDTVISQSDPLYLDHLIRYNKTVQQRNALLKFFAANHQFDAENLAIYNNQMAEHAPYIFSKRKEFGEMLGQKMAYYYGLIAPDLESTMVNYVSQLADEDLEVLLEHNVSKDRVNQYTGVGIHKDDLDFSINDKGLKKFGSQGQQKSFLIALKLAQYDFLAQKQSVKPLLLLDDIFDKLDEQRVEQLVKLVHDESFGQIFITDTHAERTEALIRKISESYLLFKVNQGEMVE